MKLWVLLIVLALVSGAAAAPPEEAIAPLDKYTTEKGKTLGMTFEAKLRQIYARVYHCRPWLEVHKSGLGFTRPAGAPGDDRYLNIWVWVDQKITPEFAALSQARRASAMFSRYGVDLLRQLAADAEIFASPALTGYSVILTWLKPNERAGEGERAETLGVFADKGTVRAFVAKRIGAQEFVRRATIVAFDGRDRLGRLPLEIWEDDFATTYKLKDYEPEDTRLGC
ncbi:MAG: hypothetical protein HYV92_04230 [Candidatus Rokubacteria bacterium]|nr:hypothetical protein [Candidatus Rokubacteria bacterium]MBI2553630.1 hypothetical protein [Candidatus Rokubacteria bacterium]